METLEKKCGISSKLTIKTPEGCLKMESFSKFLREFPQNPQKSDFRERMKRINHCPNIQTFFWNNGYSLIKYETISEK